MIYIVTAMYPEAHPFITRFQLKKDTSHTRFQVFLNKEIRLCLIISGTGPVPAAVAVSSICTEYGAGRKDFLLNAGVCAQIGNKDECAYQANNFCRTGEIFLCSKIKEHGTGRTFYPDILYRHKFKETQIITGIQPYEKTAPGITADTDLCLYDMEAAAIYQAGAYYFGPHQMSFLKVISDDGNIKSVTPAQIEGLIAENMESIADYISTLQTVAQKDYPDDLLYDERQDRTLPEKHPDKILTNEHQEKVVHTACQYKLTQSDNIAQTTLEKLCLDLHCSRTMSESLRQHIRYCMLSGVDYLSVLEEMYQEGKLPCKDKREGKQCFDELKKRLL